MQKVYLEISGVEMPYSVVGNYVYDDERFYVLDDGEIRRKIKWSKILYIEDVSRLRDRLVQTSEQGAAPKAQEVKNEVVEINVSFTGHKEQVFKIPGVSKELLKNNSWSPELAKLIFSTPQIKAFMGNFVVNGISVEGENVYIKTVPTTSKKPEAQMTQSNNAAVAAEKFQKGAELMGKIFQTAEGKFPKPTGNYPTSFNMVASPFEEIVELTEEANPQEESA